MGVVIFTKDDARYRTGDYFAMYGELTVSPSLRHTTYILHINKFSEKDAIYWAKVVPFRLVVVTDKLPKLTKASEECVILDQSIKTAKPDFSRKIRAALCWADRDRAHTALGPIPLPLANAFIKVNVHDINLGRLLARCRYTLHENYTRAAIAYGIHPVHDFKWPSKKAKNDYIVPDGIRQTDKHIATIVNNDTVAANELRINNMDALPAGLNKTKQDVIQWL
tara:strand:+ start:5609 stop:6277 length:669 start_codon:yes stop_codon:yes gene_type:complete